MSGCRRDEQRSRPAVGEDHQAAVRKRLLGAGSDGSQRHGIADTQGGIGGHGGRYPEGHVLNEDQLKSRLSTIPYEKGAEIEYSSKEEIDELKSRDRKSPTDIFFADRPGYDAWGQEDLEKLPLKDVIAKEQEMLSTHVPLYHGQSLAHWANTHFINSFVQQAFSDPKLTGRFWLRNPFDEANQKFSSVADRSKYLKDTGQEMDFSKGRTDNSSNRARELLSANPSLMQNSDEDAMESTADFVYDNNNVQGPRDTGTLTSLFKQVGLAEKEKTYTQAIDSLVEKHLSIENARGVIYQIFVPHEEVRALGYISKKNGIPDESNPDALKTLLSMQIPSENLESELPNRRSLQARILMTRLMEPEIETGVEIIPYFDKNPKVQEGIHEVEKGIDQLVDKLLSEIK
jgi:hypothetical protein